MFILHFDLSDSTCSRLPIIAICQNQLSKDVIEKIQNEIYQLNIYENPFYYNVDLIQLVKSIFNQMNIKAEVKYPYAYIYNN